jgi:hypothetical protein
MELRKEEIIKANQFLKMLSVIYGSGFADELNNLSRALDEVFESENEQELFWHKKFIESQKEIEMLRTDLQELSKEYFKK